MSAAQDLVKIRHVTERSATILRGIVKAIHEQEHHQSRQYWTAEGYPAEFLAGVVRVFDNQYRWGNGAGNFNVAIDYFDGVMREGDDVVGFGRIRLRVFGNEGGGYSEVTGETPPIKPYAYGLWLPQTFFDALLAEYHVTSLLEEIPDFHKDREIQAKLHRFKHVQFGPAWDEDRRSQTITDYVAGTFARVKEQIRTLDTEQENSERHQLRALLAKYPDEAQTSA